MVRNPKRINEKRITPKPIMVKLLETNNKERNLDNRYKVEKTHYADGK